MNLKWLPWVMKKHLEKRYSCTAVHILRRFHHSLSFYSFLFTLFNLSVTLITKGFLSAKDERDQQRGVQRMEESRWANTVHVMVTLCSGHGIDINRHHAVAL